MPAREGSTYTPRGRRVEGLSGSETSPSFRTLQDPPSSRPVSLSGGGVEKDRSGGVIDGPPTKKVLRKGLVGSPGPRPRGSTTLTTCKRTPVGGGRGWVKTTGDTGVVRDPGRESLEPRRTPRRLGSVSLTCRDSQMSVGSQTVTNGHKWSQTVTNGHKRAVTSGEQGDRRSH